MRLQDEQNCCSNCQARFEHRANKGSYNTGKRELNSVIAWQSFHCGIRHCHCTAQENCYLQRTLMPNKECSEELNQSIGMTHSCHSYNGVEEDKTLFLTTFLISFSYSKYHLPARKLSSEEKDAN